jgi:hypothetical protein
MLVVAAVLSPVAMAQEADEARPGELITERPTLICLGFEWRLTGDENRNAEVAVAYRKVGQDKWRPAVGLYRTGGGRANYGYSLLPREFKPEHISLPDGFAGSILNLAPGTTYEVRLTMTDPDGVKGQAQRLVTLATRGEPEPWAKGEVRHVYPPKFKGEKKQPAYRSIMHAVNGHHPWCDCFQTVHPYKARPGTIIKVHAGQYKARRGSYRDAAGLWQHGTHVLVADGEPGKPIAIVAAGDGEVIIDGDGADNLFNVMGADYLHFEGLTIRNTRIAFHGGFQGVIGCKGLTVKNCRLENIDYGVLAQDGRSEDFYIADNVFLGGEIGPREDGAYAVNLSGQGHVVCYNYTERFWDHINVFTNALADPKLGQQARSIDFYNNDMRFAQDNFIETDGGLMNIRVMRNRLVHCPFMGWGDPMSTQPVYQGPVYFLRNIVYNAAQGKTTFKYPGRGLVAWHNTSTSSVQYRGFPNYLQSRNNAYVPMLAKLPPDARNPPQVVGVRAEPGLRIDHNAYLNNGRNYAPYVMGRGKDREFYSLADLARATGYDRHSIEVTDYSIFEDVPRCGYVYGFRAAWEAAKDSGKSKYELDWVENDALDFTPSEGSPLVDAGVVIPGINDDYAGQAPDIGAIERGKPKPHFGPRTRKVKREP